MLSGVIGAGLGLVVNSFKVILVLGLRLKQDNDNLNIPKIHYNLIILKYAPPNTYLRSLLVHK